MTLMKNNKIKTCIGCQYYYITWEKKHPKGCKGFGFKTSRMPCDVVRETSGKECTMHIQKQK